MLNARMFSPGPSTVGRGKCASTVKKINSAAKAALKADSKKQREHKYLEAMNIWTQGKIRVAQESEIDELEHEETVEDGIIKIAAKSGLDLKDNTATIDQVIKVLKTFIKGKLKNVVFVVNQDGVPVVTLDGIMKTIKKDPSIIGL